MYFWNVKYDQWKCILSHGCRVRSSVARSCWCLTCRGRPVWCRCAAGRRWANLWVLFGSWDLPLASAACPGPSPFLPAARTTEAAVGYQKSACALCTPPHWECCRWRIVPQEDLYSPKEAGDFFYSFYLLFNIEENSVILGLTLLKGS